MRKSLGTAAGLGAVTGLRSFTGAALLARELSHHEPPRWRSRRRPRLERWLEEPAVARTLQVLAAGELIADKLPGTPDRIAPPSLAGRGVIGGLLGAICAGEDRRLAGAAIGAGAAVAAAFAGWWLRREAARVTYLPDAAVAIAEDAVAVATAREIVTE